MIIDETANHTRYRSLGTRIGRALEYLAKTDFASVEDGKHPIEGDDIFALLMSYDTEPESVRRFEAHRKYLDVQCILSGTEIISRLQLTPGTFAMFYPEDAHKPNCAWDDPQPVRKTVVKVRIG
jgi:biofilm protein TabA